MLGALDLSKWHVDVLARSAPSQSISEVYWAMKYAMHLLLLKLRQLSQFAAFERGQVIHVP